jgi:hypothetical protein
MSEGYLFGVAALILFWVFSLIVTKGNPWPWALAISENPEGPRKLSASKFQALVWTLTTLFAYGSVFGARLLALQPGEALPELPNIPLNLLVLMGLSAVTAAGSKGVSISYKSQGRIPDKSGGLTTNPKGEGDLIKTQMLVWTIVAAGIYLLNVRHSISNGSYIMPDVEGALLVLMGVSQGTYIGNKLVTTTVTKTPKIIEILPLKGPAGTTITILGESFGSEQGASFVAFDHDLINKEEEGLVSWSDLKIQVTVPTTYQPDDEIRVRVNRDGEWNENKHSFRVTT